MCVQTFHFVRSPSGRRAGIGDDLVLITSRLQPLDRRDQSAPQTIIRTKARIHLLHMSTRLHVADTLYQHRTCKPIEGREWGTVWEPRVVLDKHRHTEVASARNPEVSAHGTSDLSLDDGGIFRKMREARHEMLLRGFRVTTGAVRG